MAFAASKRRVLVMTGLCGLVVAAAGSYWLYGPRKSRDKSDDFRTTRHIPPRLPVTTVPVKPVQQAIKALKPEEMVLGVTVGKESRAYPINILNERPERKVLNDTLGGKAIVATW